MRSIKSFFCLLFVISILSFSCKTEKKAPQKETLPSIEKSSTTTENLRHAQKFAIEKTGDITLITVFSPWPNAKKDFKYALIPREKAAAITLNRDEYDAIVLTPIERIVVTSTTHIPTLEMLGVENTLVGFPQTNYISSEKTRSLIDAGKVKDIGQNEQINIELLIDLQPELVIGFSINNSNPTYKTIQKANIPVVYNGDWTEKTPLGRAEWIHFFAPFFQKEAKATKIFTEIEKEYLEAKVLAQKATTKPTILAGIMYKDIWYLPAGESFQATYLKDANADYIWSETEGTGSLSLSIESVLDKAVDADVWIGPGRYKSYENLKEASRLYAEFEAFQNKKIFSTANTVGKTGGTIYYELAATRPDIVLKDIIKAIHPEILPNYQPFFFKPLH
ncbi:periplasmic binding protein [Kordia sp. SMS9]|nr:ABC transporter substrate-binding protein [Kordia sp. SMS9]AXG71752.1 periplasmic binding protein [Kordia sp. SMS9]